MGQKVHPIGFRLGIIKDWQGRWYANRKEYTSLLHEDIQVRSLIMKRLADAGVSHVEIERSANQMTVIISAAKPGIVIGKAGTKVEELRKQLEALTGKKVRVTIQEIRQPELDATLVARSVAEQLERRVAFRRAMKQAVQRATRFGAKGIRVQVAGRLGGAEMSRTEWEREGRVPLHTLRADIDFGQAEAHTTYGVIGVKAWIYRGDVLPEAGDGEGARAAPPPPPPPPRGGRGGRDGGPRGEGRGRGPSAGGSRPPAAAATESGPAPAAPQAPPPPAPTDEAQDRPAHRAPARGTTGAGSEPGTTNRPAAEERQPSPAAEPPPPTSGDLSARAGDATTSGPGVTNLPPPLDTPPAQSEEQQAAGES